MPPKTSTKYTSPQLPELAFTFTGVALQHDIEDRQEGLILNARNASGLDLDPSYYPRPSLTPTSEELCKIEDGETEKYLWVGLVLTNVPSEVHKLIKKGTVVGTDRPVAAGLYKITEAPNSYPFRAVTPVLEKERGGGNRYYALSQQVRGLCTPYKINHDEIFFFNEFRSNTTSMVMRKPAWNKLVSKAALQAASDGQTVPIAKQMHFKKATDTTRLVFDLNQSFAANVQCLTAAFATSRDLWILHELKRVLEAADPDLNAGQLLPQNGAIRKFIGRPSVRDWTDEDSGHFMSEAILLWPELQLSACLVTRLRRGILESGVAIEHRLLRGFLAFAARRVDREGMPTDEAGFVVEALEVAALMAGDSHQSTTSFESNQAGALLHAVLLKLKEAVAASKSYKRLLIDHNGDVATAENMSDVWLTYKNSLDDDSAKLAFNQACRYAFAAIAAMNDPISQTIGELVEILERARI